MLAIYNILATVQAFPYQSAEYVEKMMHLIPPAKVVDREGYILRQCKDRSVLNLGSSSGTLHRNIEKVARLVVGVDRKTADIVCDLDVDPQHLETLTGIELIVAGEIIEHLANPGRLLQSLRTLNVPLLITVPNALSSAASSHSRRGYENVNADHVAWYSYTTLATLVTRYGFRLSEFRWYGGKPITAEGLIFLVN
jgi:hypothetical protein